MLKKDEVFYNDAKWRLKKGERLVGAWLQTGSPVTAEILAKAEFDFLMVDLEHGIGDTLTLFNQLTAISNYGVAPLVRAPWNDLATIKRILDIGVHGLLVPYVSTKEEAESVIKACKYPPEGIRGIAPSPRAGGFGMNGMNYLSKANEQLLILVAIETPQAVLNIEEILSVEGLDGVFIGPMDLSTSMGFFCNPQAQQVKEAIARVEEAVQRSDKLIGTISGSTQQSNELIKKGYNFILAMSDSTTLGKVATQCVKEFKELL